MTIAFAQSITFALGAYFGIGVIIALLFLMFGVGRLDAAAKGASFLFRPMIFLGCVALWPYVVLRTLSFRRINEPTESEE